MKRAIVLCIALLAACTSVPNQPSTVRGTVTDPSGAPLPGVTVTLHTATGDRTAVTSAAGTYEFAEVAPGKYEIEVARSGFRESRSKIAVAAGKDVRSDAKLNAHGNEPFALMAASP